MTDWLDELSGNGRVHASHVLVSVIRTQGSCPRNAGTHMLVTAERCIDTIGGGHLEYRAIALARELLADGESAFRIERFALGARLGQCCGGIAYLAFEVIPVGLPAWVKQLAALRQRDEPAVLVTLTPGSGLVGIGKCATDGANGSSRMNGSSEMQSGSEMNSRKLIVTSSTVMGYWSNEVLQHQAEMRAQSMLREPGEAAVDWQGSVLLERIEPARFNIAIFGAGHVGKALVSTLATLPCRIDWIDSRAEEFPDAVPGNVNQQLSDYPEDEVQDLPSGSHVVIMTHSHALDQRICEAALKRDDLAWCGLIGSDTKRTLFERRLRARGLGSQALARLTCPIGVAGIDGKHPAEIAIAVAAGILQTRQSLQQVSAAEHPIPCCQP